MEWCIIHHDHSSFVKCRKQEILKPILKQLMIHHSGVLTGSKDFISHLSGCNTCTRKAASSDPAMDQLSSGTITILSVIATINPCFIHVCYIFPKNIGYFILVLGYFIVILLFICDRLFFVWSSTVLMLYGQPPDSSEISQRFFWYTSGCWATYALSFSGSIFFHFRLGVLGFKFPLSFNCFSHFRMVETDTLNISFVPFSVCPPDDILLSVFCIFLDSSYPYFITLYCFFQVILLYIFKRCASVLIWWASFLRM